MAAAVSSSTIVQISVESFIYEYSKLDEIGRGAFGNVYRGRQFERLEGLLRVIKKRYKVSEECVAIKTIHCKNERTIAEVCCDGQLGKLKFTISISSKYVTYDRNI